MHIGEKIKSRRKELRISVDELASILGKDRSTIYRYEKGDIESLPLDILEPIAKALHTTPVHLMGWEENQEQLSSNSTLGNELSRKIKELRTQQKLTLEEVASKVGVGKSTVRKWETGMIANMGQDKVTVLAEALHTTPGYLMGWEESNVPQNVSSSLDNEFLQILSTLSDEDKEWLLDVIKSVIDRRK